MSQERIHPGYEEFEYEFSTLIAAYPPPFIFVNDPISVRTTSSVVRSILRDNFGDAPIFYSSAKVCYAVVDAVLCFSARILYDSVLNQLANWEAKWEDGCTNWSKEGERFNENLDGFLHGIRAVHAHQCKENGIRSKKRNDNNGEGVFEDVRIVIVIERAERLRDHLPDLIVPLSRIAELSRLDLTLVLVSEVRWEDIRPSLGASPDPYFMDIPVAAKEDIVDKLLSNFDTISNNSLLPSNANLALETYHPSFKPLYTHFATVLCDVCYPFTHDYQDMEYVAAARWPGFAKPVLDEHRQKLATVTQPEEEDMDVDTLSNERNLVLSPLSEETRMFLSRLFNPSLSIALEALYPRITNAEAWAAANEPDHGLLAQSSGYIQPLKGVIPKLVDGGLKSLPRMSKFILVSSFLASTNPVKSDLRMFGRGLDEKKRRRRVTRASGKTKTGPAKIPQRLLGPAPFALDRLIAILGALLEENDVESRPITSEYTIPGEYTDMEITRVDILASVAELTSMRLLHRTSPSDRLDGPPMFKCNISFDMTLSLARQLEIPLNDLLWDPL